MRARRHLSQQCVLRHERVYTRAERLHVLGRRGIRGRQRGFCVGEGAQEARGRRSGGFRARGRGRRGWNRRHDIDVQRGAECRGRGFESDVPGGRSLGGVLCSGVEGRRRSRALIRGSVKPARRGRMRFWIKPRSTPRIFQPQRTHPKQRAHPSFDGGADVGAGTPRRPERVGV